MNLRIIPLVVLFLAAFSFADAPAPATPGTRDFAAIQKDLADVSKQLSGVLSSPNQLFDPETRAQIGPKVLPIFKKMAALMEEAGNANPQFKQAMSAGRLQLLAILSVLGDNDSLTTLNMQAASSDAKVAVPAKSALLMADWIKTAKDPAAQGKVLDNAEILAKANPSETSVVEVLGFFSQIGSASPELKDRATKIITDDLKGPMADSIRKQMAGEQKLKSMENKPLVLSGPSLNGTTFSTDTWKGKVILVDFWATWCGPCRAELPRVKKAYADFHDKGLEVLGVSCDNTADDLKKFLGENKDMPWPQLFDAASPGWHPLAKQFGIEGIPTMFLIDKKGVLRTVEAREDFEKQIPKLLAE